MEDCVPVGQTLFRKLNLYTLDEWQTTPHPETKDLVNLGYFKLYPAPFAGPFALIRDEAKFAAYVRDGRPMPIRVYTMTCSTKHIGTFLVRYTFFPTKLIIRNVVSLLKWEGEKLLKLSWTHDENLLCVQVDGTIRIMTMFGEKIREFKMDADRKLIDFAPVFSSDYSTTGLVGLNAVSRFLYIPDISAESGQLKAFEDIPGLSLDTLKWGVSLTPNYTRLFVINDRDFYQADLDGPLIKLTYPNLNFNRFVNLAISMGGIYLALLTDRSVIITTTGDPLRITIEHVLTDPVDSKCSLHWVGTDGVALFSPSVGLTIFQLATSESHTEMMEPTAYFVPEVDGLRIITSGSHDLLHAVPQEVSEVLALGSQSPAMYLYEANKHFKSQNSSGATEYLDSGVRLRLEEAVTRCISAALYEYKASLQKNLLEAANLGRCFLLATSAGRLSWRAETAEIVRVIRILRVLNVVREYMAGMPLTYKQFCVFYQRNYPLAGFQWLLLRLTKRRQAALAFLMCDYLASAEDCCPADSVSSSPSSAALTSFTSGPNAGANIASSPLHETVLRTWAAYKLNQSRESEEAIAASLLAKLSKSNLLAEIARLAIEKGRRTVARRLIEAEPRPMRQVPLLLQIGEYQLALGRAVASHNPDLISRVMDDLRQVMDNTNFLVLLHRHESAIKFYLQQLEERHDFDSYLKIADQESDFLGQAIYYLQVSIKTNDDPRDSYRRSAEQFSRKRGYEWAAESVHLCRQLFERQTKLDQELQSSSRKTTLNDTVRLLGKSAKITTALAMKKEFQMSDKSWWWAYANGLADGNNWDALDEFTKGKAKTPFGITGVLEICAAHNHCSSIDVNGYLARLEAVDRVKGHVIIGRFDKAFEAAMQSSPKTIEADLEYLLKRLPSAQSDLKGRVKEHLKTVRQQQPAGGSGFGALRLGGGGGGGGSRR